MKSTSEPSTALDARRGGDERVGEPGEHADPGWDRTARVDERLERRQALAAADLDDTDLGDHVVVAVAAGGLEVEHAERRLGQRNARDRRSCAVPTSRRRPWGAIEPRTHVRVKNNCSGRRRARPVRSGHGRHAGRRRTAATPQAALEHRHLRSALGVRRRDRPRGPEASAAAQVPGRAQAVPEAVPAAVDGARPGSPRASRPTTRSGRGSRPAPCPSSSIRSGSCGSSAPTAGPSASPSWSSRPTTRRPAPTPQAALHREAAQARGGRAGRRRGARSRWSPSSNGCRRCRMRSTSSEADLTKAQDATDGGEGRADRCPHRGAPRQRPGGGRRIEARTRRVRTGRRRGRQAVRRGRP